jgi:hypothetical protein
MEHPQLPHALVKTVYGVSVDTVSLVTAATNFPRLQNAVVALGIIKARQQAGKLVFKAGKPCTRVGELPREVAALVAEHYWRLLYNDPKLGYAHFELTTLCPGCRSMGIGDLEEAFTGECVLTRSCGEAS